MVDDTTNSKQREKNNGRRREENATIAKLSSPETSEKNKGEASLGENTVGEPGRIRVVARKVAKLSWEEGHYTEVGLNKGHTSVKDMNCSL